jgi:transcriptional regulator with XRE-family HTH domain
MTTRNLIRPYFSNRLKIERVNRDWSQATMAELLKERGIDLHPTALAKIEAKQRDVRIDEAAAIADLFDIPLDALLGRHVRRDTALDYVLRGVKHAARRSAQQIAGTLSELDDSLADVDTMGFDGREELEANLRRAKTALRKAQAALEDAARFVLPAQAPPTLRQGKSLASQETRTVMVGPGPQQEIPTIVRRSRKKGGGSSEAQS